MGPEFKALKHIKYSLDAIKELRYLHSGDVKIIRTYSGKLSSQGISRSDFMAILGKISSETGIRFRETSGNSATGWGSNLLNIEIDNWNKFEEYYKTVDGSLEIYRTNIKEGSSIKGYDKTQMKNIQKEHSGKRRFSMDDPLVWVPATIITSVIVAIIIYLLIK